MYFNFFYICNFQSVFKVLHILFCRIYEALLHVPSLSSLLVLKIVSQKLFMLCKNYEASETSKAQSIQNRSYTILHKGCDLKIDKCSSSLKQGKRISLIQRVQGLILDKILTSRMSYIFQQDRTAFPTSQLIKRPFQQYGEESRNLKNSSRAHFKRFKDQTIML